MNMLAAHTSRVLLYIADHTDIARHVLSSLLAF
jgi:hypothetical protein